MVLNNLIVITILTTVIIIISMNDDSYLMIIIIIINEINYYSSKPRSSLYKYGRRSLSVGGNSVKEGLV